MANSGDSGEGRRKVQGERARAICHGFFDAHTHDHPEEATTLGLWKHGGRLSDPSRAASERELARLSPMLRAVESLLADPTGLDLDARLDLDAVARYARHRVRWIERDYDASTLEVCTMPNSSLQHSALHAETRGDVERIAQRARATPEHLARHTENLRRGVRDGRAVDRTCVVAYVERVLPGAATSCARLATDVGVRMKARGVDVSSVLVDLGESGELAADAYRKLTRILADEIAPHARAEVALGEEEVAFRLRDVMGLETSIPDLLAFGRRLLATARAKLVDRVQRSGHPEVKTAEQAREPLMALLGAKPATLEEALGLYRRHTDDAVRLIRERGLLPLPDPLAFTLTPLPGGIADGTNLTNWPAPLLDPRGHGHALYSMDPNDHGIVQAKNLSVHEGIPGHYLQSVVWQRGKKSPVRFLGVSDEIAGSRGYFGTMMSVEGWAVHMEHLLREEGFFDDGPEAIFEAFVATIHAVRIINDLEVHCEGKGDDAAAKQFADATLLPERWARMQVLRSRRIPLQHLTYFVGAHEIAELRSRAFAAGASKSEFYGRLLDYGPVPPSRLTDTFARR